jgi:hypothetical protein
MGSIKILLLFCISGTLLIVISRIVKIPVLFFVNSENLLLDQMEGQVEQLQVHLLLYFVNEQHEKVRQVQSGSNIEKKLNNDIFLLQK